jgi:tetratricopeptide (TPR) repeat protein
MVELLWGALTKETIVIAPIAVPRTLAEAGYTADVAAQRLHDALNKVVEVASEKGPRVALQADLPNVVVPAVGLSLETIAADIRALFHITGRWNISGELTIAQRQLRLRLRMNGQDIYRSPNGVDPERPDDLLAPAAEKLADPYTYAEFLAKRYPRKSLEIARRIITDGPEKSVPLAHNLAGNILLDQHKTDEAIADYRKAIELDPHYAWPHNNLGFALYGQLKTEEAIVEYRKAIELDPNLALPHGNLAILLRAQGKTKEADAEDQKAKELGAKHPD